MNTDEALKSLKDSQGVSELYKAGYTSKSCPHCKGLGLMHPGKRERARTCYSCNGRGLLWKPPIKC